jgi:AsmA protein
LRLIVGVLAAVLLVLVATVTLGANALLNSEAARARILAAIERATGHPARIDGPVAVAWSLEPAFSIQDVAILNRPGFSRPALATARRIEARIALLPLLEGRIELPGLWINDPDIRLERNAAGQANWVAAPQANVEASPSPSRPHTPAKIARIQLVNGTLAWQDAPELHIRALQLVPGGGPLSASLTFKDIAFEVVGTTRPATQEGIPFEATAVGGGLALAASGQAGGPTPAPIAFEAKTADLSALSPLAGLHLPPLQQVVLTGQLGPTGPAGLTLTAGPSALDHILPGLALTSLKASIASLDQPAQIEATATLGTTPITAPITATASVKPAPSGTGVLLRGLRIASPAGDLAGDLALILAPRPSLKGSLVSQHLDLDAWATPPEPAQPAPQPASQAPPQVAPPAPPPPWLIPDRPLPFAALQRADADLQWSVAALVSHGVAYQAATLRVLLQDGRLRIDPAAVLAPGGPIQLTLQADASAAPPTAALMLHAPTLDAAAVVATLGLPAAMTGGLDITLDLHASGTTPHQMAATATGRAAAALTGGEIENAVLAALFAPALRGANIPLDPAGRSRVACLALRLDADNGQAAIKALALDTSKLRLDGDGTLDLGTETMDLHLRPTIRLGPTSVAVPVHVAGPWRAPKAAADRGVIAPGRFGISIGAATPDPCGPALAAVNAP